MIRTAILLAVLMAPPGDTVEPERCYYQGTWYAEDGWREPTAEETPTAGATQWTFTPCLPLEPVVVVAPPPVPATTTTVSAPTKTALPTTGTSSTMAIVALSVIVLGGLMVRATRRR